MSNELSSAFQNRISAAGSVAQWKSVVAVATFLVLSACAEAPKAPAPAPEPTSLQDYLQQASAANSAGLRDKARDTYRIAAKAYPASTDPWSRLSSDYLSTGEFGNAILAAQEVLRRDSTDAAATNVLALSGLRVSTPALTTLRAQSRINGDTRTEAEAMAHTLHDALADDLPSQRPGTVAPSKSRSRPHTISPKTTSTNAPAAGSPFDKLKSSG